MQDYKIEDLEIEKNTTILLANIVADLKMRKLECFDSIDWDNTLKKYINYTKTTHLYAESPIEKIFLGALLMGFLVSQPDCLMLISPTRDVDSLIEREKRLIELYEQIESAYLQEKRCCEWNPEEPWEEPEEESDYLKNIDDHIFNLHKEGDISTEDYQELSVNGFRFTAKSVTPYYITPQVYIPNIGIDKKLIRCDLFIWNPFDEKLRCIIEFDGYEWHSTNEKFTEDKIRDRDLRYQSYEVLRYSGKEINQDPMSCVKDLFKHINTGELRDFSIDFHLILSDEINKEKESILKRRCPKCEGTGHLPIFIHRDGGKCFPCNGTGYIKDPLETIKPPVSVAPPVPVVPPVSVAPPVPVAPPVSVALPVVMTTKQQIIAYARKPIALTSAAVIGFLLIAWIMTATLMSGTRNAIRAEVTTNVLPPTPVVTTVAASAVSAEPSLAPTVGLAVATNQPVFHGTGRTTTVDPPWYPCQEKQIKGNKNSKIYHLPTGDFYPKTFQEVTCFNTSAEAEAAGFRAAKN